MTRYLFYVFLFALVQPLSAQKAYLPIKVNHQWGFLEVTESNTRLDTSELYDYLGDVNLPWVDQPGTTSGYYLVQKDGKIGLMNAGFEQVLKPAWQEISPISDQHFLVGQDGQYTIIDRAGVDLLNGKRYQAIRLPKLQDVSTLFVRENGKWGVHQTAENRLVIPTNYFAIEFLDVENQGLFKVKKSKIDKRWKVINWQEKPLDNLRNASEVVRVASKRHLLIQDERGETDWSIRDLTGKELLTLPAGVNIRNLNKHLLAYRNDLTKPFTVLVMQKEITPLVEEFLEVKRLNEEIAYYIMKGQSGFITPQGKLLILGNATNLNLLAAEGDVFRTKCKGENQEEKWGLYSLEAGEMIQACTYDSITPFKGRFARLIKGNKVGLVNTKGKIIAPAQFEDIPTIDSEMEKIQCYWKDSVMVYYVDADGQLDGEPYAERYISVIGKEQFFWVDYNSSSNGFSRNNWVSNTNSSFTPFSDLIEFSNRDTVWSKDRLSYWKRRNNGFQLVNSKEVEVVIRERSVSAKKKKKKKRKKKKKKKGPPAPKRTEIVTKWIPQNEMYIRPRSCSGVEWIAAYQGTSGMVENELVRPGRKKRSAQKISFFSKDNFQAILDFDVIGIRLSDFANDQAYAAFIDLDGKMGLVDKNGQQAMDTTGTPLRFTYIGKPVDGKMRVCHVESAISQVYASSNVRSRTIFRDFQVNLQAANGYTRSTVKSKGRALWGYIDNTGKMVIPFEYESAGTFVDGRALNKKQGKWGIINQDNEPVIPFEYDSIGLQKGNYIVIKKTNPANSLHFDYQGRRFKNQEQAVLANEGKTIFRAKKEEKYGFVDVNGKVLIPYDFDEAYNFSDGVATVRKGRNWYFIDESGAESVTIDPSILGIMEIGSFSNGFCPIRKTTIINKKPRRKYGYLDKQGQLAIPAVFDNAQAFDDGFAVVDSLDFSNYQPGQSTGIPRERGLIDTKGNFVIPFQFKRISAFQTNGFAEVVKDNTKERGLIDKQGNLLSNNYYEQIKMLESGFAGYDGYNWKIFDFSGTEIETNISSITKVNYFDGKHLFVKDNTDKWLHLENSDSEMKVRQGDFQVLLPFENGYAFTRLAGRSMLYGKNRTWILPNTGEKFKFWSNNLIGIATLEGEYYANLANQNTFHRTFDRINKFTGNFAPVTYQQKEGAINRNGLFIIPPKFKSLSVEKEGYVKVQPLDKLFGLISKTGEVLIPAKYDKIDYLNDQLIRVEYADFVGYYRADGRPIWELKD